MPEVRGDSTHCVFTHEDYSGDFLSAMGEWSLSTIVLMYVHMFSVGRIVPKAFQL